jgi:hypothetical protein
VSMLPGYFQYTAQVPFESSISFTYGLVTQDMEEVLCDISADPFISENAHNWILLGDNPQNLDSRGFASGHSW